MLPLGVVELGPDPFAVLTPPNVTEPVCSAAERSRASGSSRAYPAGSHSTVEPEAIWRPRACAPSRLTGRRAPTCRQRCWSSRRYCGWQGCGRDWFAATGVLSGGGCIGSADPRKQSSGQLARPAAMRRRRGPNRDGRFPTLLADGRIPASSFGGLGFAPSRALLAPPEMLVTDRKQGLAALLDPAECSRLATPRQVA
jgi:hypothetical protein